MNIDTRMPKFSQLALEFQKYMIKTWNHKGEAIRQVEKMPYGVIIFS